MFITILAFLVAIAVLIAVHEYGHFQVARWCGVKVLRFAIGFGKPVLRWQSSPQHTEFALCALPLGGYVKMLDEREGEVLPQERHLAFNTQPAWKRFVIVLAGPLANLLLAVLIYAGMAWYGTQEAAPVMAAPPPHSLADKVGLRSGDRILSIQTEGAPQAQPVQSLEQLRWELLQAALNHTAVTLHVQPHAGAALDVRIPPLAQSELEEGASNNLLEKIGITAPYMQPEVGHVEPDMPAARAGVQPADMVRSVDGVVMHDAAQLRRAILAQTDGAAHLWEVERAGQRISLSVQPDIVERDGQRVARVGAYLGSAPELVRVQYGMLDGLTQGVRRTWEISALTLRMMGRVATGQASLKNISGPITIADYAGRSAHAGPGSFMVFLALVSVSLGVLNLLPIPILDGGHLMYYCWEMATGRPVTDAWQEKLQRLGLVLLGAMMIVALFNDINRLSGAG